MNNHSYKKNMPIYNPSSLPYLVALVMEKAGEDAAMKMLLHYGGRRLSVPLIWTKWAVSTVLGEQAAKAIICERSGEMVDVPTCGQYLAMWLRLHGWSVDDVAHRLHRPRRTVLRWAQRRREHELNHDNA